MWPLLGLLQSEYRWQQDAQEVFVGRGKRWRSNWQCWVSAVKQRGFPFIYGTSLTNLSSKRINFCLMLPSIRSSSTLQNSTSSFWCAFLHCMDTSAELHWPLSLHIFALTGLLSTPLHSYAAVRGFKGFGVISTWWQLAGKIRDRPAVGCMNQKENRVYVSCLISALVPFIWNQLDHTSLCLCDNAERGGRWVSLLHAQRSRVRPHASVENIWYPFHCYMRFHYSF